jgi:malate dehydrogenase (oxaloacetate-decarboxylating)
MATKKTGIIKKNYNQESLSLHKLHGGKIALASKFPLKNRDDLSRAYTPGVGAVCMAIKDDVKLVKTLTLKKNTIAVVSDGTAVLGFGDIGPAAGIPVMEGKAVLMKHFAGVDAFPICLDTKDTEEIIKAVKQIAPVFGGVNLEDIAAPRCFEIEERLKKELGIVVMHDDQWGAATVALAALINALKVTKRKQEGFAVVMSGLGAAGVATVRLVKAYAPNARIIGVDSKGIVAPSEGLNGIKKKLFDEGVLAHGVEGGLADAVCGADVFIGLSKPGVLTQDMVRSMNKNAIVFALANPTPEIMPDEAYAAGAAVVGTGRSDFPNQINNSVFFPGFWRGVLDAAQKTDNTQYDLDLFVDSAKALAKAVKNPTAENIIPSTLDKGIHEMVAKAVKNYFLKRAK